jgi:hypothetical protein
MIQDAFNHTPWAAPHISTQPAGNVTLVGLDTYYKVNWTPQGFQPGEIDAIDPARMNGYRVDIRVKLVNFMWQFGDGQTFGPTTSEGGVYPSGNITHQYVKGRRLSSRRQHHVRWRVQDRRRRLGPYPRHGHRAGTHDDGHRADGPGRTCQPLTKPSKTSRKTAESPVPWLLVHSERRPKAAAHDRGAPRTTVGAIDLGAESGRVASVAFDGERLELEIVHRFTHTPRDVAGVLRWDMATLDGWHQAGSRRAGPG